MALTLGSRTLTEGMGKELAHQSKLVRQLAGKTLHGRAAKLAPVLLAIAETTEAVLVLARTGHPAEALMLQRAVLERTVNACYLMVCDEAEFKRYFLHATYRAVKGLAGEISVGQHGLALQFHGEVIPTPELADALELFKSSEARWTTASLRTRLKRVFDRSDVVALPFLMATQMWWADASEALHGSLYGCLLHVGAFDPTTSSALKTESAEAALASFVHRRYAFGFFLAVMLLRELTRIVAGQDASVEVEWKAIFATGERVEGLLEIALGLKAAGDG